MGILGFVILVSLIIVSLFNYLNLKKLNFPSKKCLYSSIIVFVVSFFSTSYLAIFLSMFFESFTSNINIFSIIALILVLVFNYFRIKERVIKNKKIDYKKGGIYEKIVFSILILLGLSLFISLTYSAITGSIQIWDKVPNKIVFENYGLSGTILVIINNIMVYIFGSLAYKISAVILFLLGIASLGILIAVVLPHLKTKYKNNLK